MNSDRRRVWITGIGVVTPIGTGVDAFRAGVRAGRSPVKRIDRFDASPFRSQVAAQVDDFDPLDHGAAEDRPPARPIQPVRARRAGRLALDDAGLRPGEAGRRRRSGSGSTSAAPSAASPTPRTSTSDTWRRASGQVAPNLALAVFGGAAPANLGIALDVRGPILSTANSCASGAVAIGEALGAIRAGEIDAAIAGGVEVPAEPARLRGVRHHPGARPRATTTTRRTPAGRSTRRRDGFVMGEGAALLVLEADEVVRASRRRAVRRGARLWRNLRCPPHGPAAARGREAARAATIALADAGVGAGRDRLRERPRVVDAASATSPRRGRSRWRSAIGRPSGAGQRDEGALRPSARGVRARSRRRSARWRSATDGRRPRSTWTSRTRTSAALLPGLLRERAAPEPTGAILSTSFGFGGLNAALVFGAPDR